MALGLLEGMTTPSLTTFEGALYKDNKVLRPVFNRGFSRIKNTQQLKSTLRAGQYTFPGCYPLYFITNDGCALSFEGVRKNLRECLSEIRNRDSARIIACEVNYENASLYCELTGERIESAYAEDEAE